MPLRVTLHAAVRTVFATEPARKPPKMIILDMDSSESATHGRQEGAAYNGHSGCICYHPLFCFN